jgi:tetratricopeptide (TPR) repeat protein
VLPITLFLIDVFEKRRLNYWALIDKLLMLVLSVIFGLRSISDQKSFGSLNAENIDFNFIERMALGSYAFFTYLWKAILPVKLCNFYPYPLKVNGSLPALYYSYIAIGLAILAAAAYFGRRSRVIIFGSLFFLVNIVLLLQFMPVGGAIVADRYTYIAYLGLFFMAGWGVSGFFQPGAGQTLRYASLAVCICYMGYLGYLANERCKVWYDTTTLWRDEIEKEPRDAPNAWNNLGFNYFNKYNEALNLQDRKTYFDSTYYCLNEAIRLQSSFVNPYISLGELHRTAGGFEPEKQNYYFAIAKQYYYKALSLKLFDEGPNAYLGLAIIYAISHNFDSSAYCFRQAVNGKPQFPEAQSNFGNFFDMIGKPDSALVHYGLSIAQNPDLCAPHLNRGRLLTRLRRYDEALKDFEYALALSPDNGEVEFARSMVYAQRGDKARALQDVQSAMAHGYKQINPAYIQSLNSR